MNPQAGPDNAEVQLGSERIYDGHIVNLRVDDVRTPGGEATKREVVEHPGAVAILPILPDGRVLLVRQWRYAVSKQLLEVPAGTLEEDEQPIACARRELAEETGYRAEEIDHLISFYSAPGYTTEKIDVFVARDLHPADARSDDDECIDTAAVGWDEAVAMCLDGRVTDAKTIAALLGADSILRHKDDGDGD